MEPSEPARLPVVRSGQNGEVAAALGEQALEWIAPLAQDGSPSGRALTASVEARDQAQELADLGLRRGVDEELLPDTRVLLAQDQRGVEVPRLEEHKGVH